ncbi:2-(1,2-epoxy-1,2-dihydrophenyl)acetyl-CoA isomerase PaaG [Azospira restricta]|uniref:2-(1,2-epoxy-1,2-dihydrophenyl)acetyl-CoA isomerase n=1 Tax=Azospira restricta TaxID=404405 RepID=A0A974SPC1_9RHOO|nr:2-(1,2-epoxy-1,2-dihydrophenyl)acetyl-CoA isomerase PaaG [Azospira restricta]QRJ63954.1 2-(1,2-epoxy-1,2-dihydrophenyl)acetyl-CoA isomerase [Azospira restricta]
MSEQSILYALEDGVAQITLNRPDRLNSFNTEMHLELRGALDRAAREARAVLLTGAGRGFCAGQDLSDRSVAASSAPPNLGESVETWYKPLVLQLKQLEMPVVCAVNGVAAGAGASLALACDIVLAARSASFIQAFCKIGLIPDTGGTWFLPRLVGDARALGLALTGDKLPAEKAEAWGMIWKCVDDAQLMDEARTLAKGFAAGPTRGFARTKQALRASWSNPLDDQLTIERDFMDELGRSHDYREGVAAFMEKRAPRFTGK